MSVVHVVPAGGMVILAIIAERALGMKIGCRQSPGLGMTAVGLILLGIALPVVHGARSRVSVPGMIGFEAALTGTPLVIGL